MRSSCFIAFAAVALTLGGNSLFAQEQGNSRPDAPRPQADAAKPRAEYAKPAALTHRFWDKENDWLFAGVAVSRGLDYSSTLNFRRRGRNEALLTNAIVDNHPAFAAIEAGATGVSVGVSYLFHHYGHHSLERWTSIVHIGVATGGAIRNYSLKTAH
jgi:hypothetical protein